MYDEQLKFIQPNSTPLAVEKKHIRFHFQDFFTLIMPKKSISITFLK
jgi:hypothetical protein